MKVTRIIAVLSLTLLHSISQAESLRELDIPKNLQTILSEFKFKSGDPAWKAVQDSELLDKSIFCGSAYSVFDEPTPALVDYIEIAEKIRDEFQRVSGLDSSSEGASGVSPGGAGEAHFTWLSSKGAPASSNASISLTVRVVPLRNAQIGVYLTLVDTK